MVSAVRGGGRVDVEELLSRAENAQRRAAEAQLRQQQSEARQQAQQGASGAQGGAQGAGGGAGSVGGACGPSVAAGGSGGACAPQPVRPQVTRPAATPETQRGAREAARGREAPAMQDVQSRAVDERTPVAATPETNAATQKPQGQGLERQWKQFRDVDPEKLREALPDRAKHLAQSFVDAGKKHNVDPVLLAAISRHETGNWTSAAFKRGNAMGISGTGGPRSFARPEDSVNQMAKQLADPNGYYKNASTLKDLWKIYAPSPVVGSRATNDPGGLNRHWGKNVDRYMTELEQRLG